MTKPRYHHLLREVPNNFITRWLVTAINKKMTKSESLFKLIKKYRKPKNGYKYTDFGGIVKRNSNELKDMPPVYKRARAFSLYLRNR